MSDYEESVDEGELEGRKKQRASTAGRKLMRWNPDVDQYVLLAVEIVCNEQGTPVPWNLVAGKINDYVTGESVKQHLAKVRKYREENGRSVPQKYGKGGDGMVAGYGTGLTETAHRNGKKSSKNAYGDEGDDSLIRKGKTLLWTNPYQKRLAQSKEQKSLEVKEEGASEPGQRISMASKKRFAGEEAAPAEPETPAKKSRKPGRKVEVEGPASSRGKSTGKRGRTKKAYSIGAEHVDDDLGNDSPTKKQRTYAFRPTHEVDYAETSFAEAIGGEDEFDARPYGDDDEADDDGFYGSQPGTVLNSGAASSYSSHRGLAQQSQPAPDFDNMMFIRTGTHAYHGGYTDDSHDLRLDGPFSGPNTGYGPPAFGDMSEMAVDHGSMGLNGEQHFSGSLQPTADQLQMRAGHGDSSGFMTYGNTEQANTYSNNPSTGLGKSYKQGVLSGRYEDETTTPVKKVKKKNKKNDESTKQSASGEAKPTSRQDSVQKVDNSGNQDVNFFGERMGYIPVANDTGRGLNPLIGQNPPNFSPSLDIYGSQEQPQPTFTASQTHLNSSNALGGLPTPSNNNNTVITPHVNRFTFDHNGFAVPITDFNALSDDVLDGVGNLANIHGNFSSSNDTSATMGVQTDQNLPSAAMHFHRGLHDPWMPQMSDEHHDDALGMLNDDNFPARR